MHRGSEPHGRRQPVQPGALEDPRLPAGSDAQLAEASRGRGTRAWGLEVPGGVLPPPGR